MLKIIITIIFCLISSIIYAIDIPKVLQQDVKDMQNVQKMRILILEDVLKNPKIHINIKKQARQEINSIKKDGTIPKQIPNLHPSYLSVGDIGSLYAGLEIGQILNDKEMFIIPYRLKITAYTRKINMGPRILFRGWSTKNYTTGQRIISNEWTKVTGTYKYTTVMGGTNTIFIIEPLNIEKLKPFLKIDKPNQLKTTLKSLRIWTDKTGRFSIKASFMGYLDGKVKLYKENKQTIIININNLSIDDQNYIKNLR